MNKSGITGLLQSLYRSLREHSPAILTGLGITGMFTGAIMAVKATPRALKAIDIRKNELNTEKLEKRELIRTCWKIYIPSFSIGVLSSVCILSANVINSKRNAAIATAYSLSESALKIYQDKVIETIGEKEEKKIRDEVAKENINKHPIVSNEVIITDKGQTLCYDVLSGRYFKSDMESLKKSINELNRQLTFDMYVSLNDFYDAIGLSEIKVGDDLGWNINKGLIDPIFSSQLATDGTPCLVIDHRQRPEYDYT